jgi:phosphoglycerol transferase MdoB-like AlkP superfamily enzyme
MRHGFVFLVLALCLGLGIVLLPHPGRWLAAHLTALLTGPILMATGLAWRELRLTPGQRALSYRCALISAYTGLVANVFGAIVDLPGPASNPGVAPPMPQAAVFFALLAIIVPTLFIAFGLAVYGMRGDGAVE